MSKKQAKKNKDSTANKNNARSLELSTNVNDYDTGESLDCNRNNNIVEAARNKKNSNKSAVVKTGDKFMP